MNAIAGALRELWGLFVDDLSYSIAIGLWVALAAVGFDRVGLDPKWRGGIFFAGLALIVLENVARSARKRKD